MPTTPPRSSGVVSQSRVPLGRHPTADSTSPGHAPSGARQAPNVGWPAGNATGCQDQAVPAAACSRPRSSSPERGEEGGHGLQMSRPSEPRCGKAAVAQAQLLSSQKALHPTPWAGSSGSGSNGSPQPRCRAAPRGQERGAGSAPCRQDPVRTRRAEDSARAPSGVHSQYLPRRRESARRPRENHSSRLERGQGAGRKGTQPRV